MSTITTTASDGNRILWGFMFENTLFTEFERRNHPVIEAAYRQRKKKHSSHHVTIVDSNLPKPGKAKVYFGVAQNHLRMPGTRYYVTRQLIKSTSSPFTLPMLVPSPSSTFSSSSFSSLDTSFMCHQTSKQKKVKMSQKHQQSSKQQQQTAEQIRQMQQFNSNTLASVLSSFSPLLEVNYDFPSTVEYNVDDNILYHKSTKINNPCMYRSSSKISSPPMINNLPTNSPPSVNSSLPLNNYLNNNMPLNSNVPSNSNIPLTNNLRINITPTNINPMNMFIPDLDALNILEDPNWMNDILCLAPHTNQVSWSSSAPTFDCSIDNMYFYNLMMN